MSLIVSVIGTKYSKLSKYFECQKFVYSKVKIHWTRNYWNEPVDNRREVESWTEYPYEDSVFRGKSNKKFVAPDGHSEAVFDCYDNVVKDSNMGTFNYFDLKLMGGVPHAVADISLFLIFGVSPTDMVTGFPQRVKNSIEYLEHKASGTTPTGEDCSCE